MSDEEENNRPLLDNILTGEDPNILEKINKNDEEMRDSFETYSKLLNKMKKNVDSMGDNKLMNYKNLFSEFDNDMIKFNEEQKKLLELKDILNNEVNLPENVKKDLEKVNNDFENKKKIFESLKSTVEDYKAKYTQEENNKYDNMFNDAKEGKNEEENNDPDQKLIIKNNDQIMEERKNIIEQAKKTSSQVADTSKVIKNVVNQQGENINDIENNIIEAVDNFKKGGEEIKKFKKKTEEKINKKKICYVIAGFLLLLLVIIFLSKKLF